MKLLSEMQLSQVDIHALEAFRSKERRRLAHPTIGLDLSMPDGLEQPKNEALVKLFKHRKLFEK